LNIHDSRFLTIFKKEDNYILFIYIFAFEFYLIFYYMSGKLAYK